VWRKRGTMVLMDWRLSRSLIPSSMMIFLNSGSKQIAKGFPIGCLQDLLFYYKKWAESLGSGLEGEMELGKGG